MPEIDKRRTPADGNKRNILRFSMMRETRMRREGAITLIKSINYENMKLMIRIMIY